MCLHTCECMYIMYIFLHTCECIYICQPINIYFVLQIMLCFKLRLYFSCFNVFFLLLKNDISRHMISENWEGNNITHEHQGRYKYKMSSHAGQLFKVMFLIEKNVPTEKLSDTISGHNVLWTPFVLDSYSY